MDDADTITVASRDFGVSMRPRQGPLENTILTAYRGGRDPRLQETLARRHEAYIDCLRLAGIRVPQTNLRLLNDAGVQRPVIVQKALPDDVMLPRLIKTSGLDGALALLDRVATDVADFWRKVAQRPERIGLHARLDAFAMDENGTVFCKTFPPLISYNRDEMGQLIHRFADSALIRGVGKVLPGRVRDIQDRWYSPSGSINTLIDGAIRLRPQEGDAIAAWAREFADARMDPQAREAVITHLAKTAQRRGEVARRWPILGGRDRPHA